MSTAQFSVLGAIPGNALHEAAKIAQKIVVPMRESATVTVTVYAADNSPQDLAGGAVLAYVRKLAAGSPSDGDVLLARQAVTQSPSSAGTAAFDISASDYDALGLAPGCYRMDLWFRFPDGTQAEIASPFRFIVTDASDPAGPVTVPPTQVPFSPLPPNPGYNADLVIRGGLYKWRQHERAKAVFDGSTNAVAVTWPTFATRVFDARPANPVVTTLTGYVNITLTGVTATGCTVNVSDAFIGEVDIDIAEVL